MEILNVQHIYIKCSDQLAESLGILFKCFIVTYMYLSDIHVILQEANRSFAWGFIYQLFFIRVFYNKKIASFFYKYCNLNHA